MYNQPQKVNKRHRNINIAYV